MASLFFEIKKKDQPRDREFERIEKFNLNHDPVTGQFCSGTVSGGISSHTMKHGGMSVHIKTGKQPKSGYMVAAHVDRSHWISAEDASNPDKVEKAISDFIEKNKDLLSKKENYLGTWYDESTGMISLDISTCVQDKDSAVKFASEHNEKAIWDVKNGTEISTGGTGNNIT